MAAIDPFVVTLTGPEGSYSVAFSPDNDEGCLDLVISGIQMRWKVDYSEIVEDGQIVLGGLTWGTQQLWSDVYWFELRRGVKTHISYWGDRVLIRTDYEA